MSESISPDPKDAAPMQLAIAPAPVRRRKVFLRHKYTQTITIREIDKDRPNARVVKIAATLDSAKARMRIVATKLADRMERKLDLMEDSGTQMTTKEYKEFVDGLEKVNVMINESFGVSGTPASNAPVNNGIIINNSQGNDELSRILSRVAAKSAGPAAIDLPPEAK